MGSLVGRRVGNAVRMVDKNVVGCAEGATPRESVGSTEGTEEGFAVG